MKINMLICALMMSLLVGCGAEDSGPDSKETVFDPQLKALEKAKGVDTLLQDTEEKRRKSLEASTGQTE